MTALQEAISKAGGQSELASKLSRFTGRQYRQNQISNWLHRGGGKPPANVVLAIEHLTGIDRAKLRPDVFAEVTG